MAAGSASGPMTHGARAILVTPMPRAGRRVLNGRLGVQRGGHHREREPRREQERGDAGRADRFFSAHRGQDDAVGRGRDAEHAHPVGPGQPGVGEPVVQRLGQQRVGVVDLADVRGGPLAVMASRTARILAGAASRPAESPRPRGAGRRLAAASASTARIPAGRRGRRPRSAVRTSRAGLSTRSTVVISAVTPPRPSSPASGTARTRAGALSAGWRHRAPVTAAGCDQPGRRPAGGEPGWRG